MTAPATPVMVWPGLALPLPGGQVILSREAAMLILAAFREASRRASALDGGGPRLSPAASRIVAALQVAAECGHADVRRAPDPASSEAAVRADDLITVKEAAAMLNLEPRHVRRLARAEAFGRCGMKGRSIVVARSEVAADIVRRQEMTP